jgi:DNA-binding LacI/PurR family transcriptional regulator
MDLSRISKALGDAALEGMPKYERLRDQFVDELATGRMRPGDVFPPEPVIAEQLKVARSTVRQALADLERNGLIRRVRGRGTFVHEEARARLRSGLDVFALVVPETRSGYYPSLLASFEEAAVGTHNQVIVVSTRDDAFRQADSLLQLIDKRVAGIAVVPAASPPTPPYHIRQVQSQHIPVVLCHRGVAGVRAPVLTFNGRDVGGRAAQAMLRRGHRRIAYVSAARSELALSYEAGLRSALEAAGAALPAERVVYVEEPFREDFAFRMETAVDRLLRLPDRPTALFASFDSIAEMIYLQLLRGELSVPRDVSLVSFGGKSRFGPMQQRLTSVTVDEEKIGRLAVELLNEMRAGRLPIESDDRIEIELGLSEGETLGDAPS